MFLGILILSLLLSSKSAADVYKYVDENEVIHLTNVPAGPRYRILIQDGAGNGKPEAELGPYDALIAWAAGKYDVDLALVKAVIKTESNFDPKAVSRMGAKGLMQLMPRTAQTLGVRNCFHPGDNIDGGIRYLSYLIDLYQGNLSLVLAAYNAGEGAVAKHGGIPPYSETRTYVRRVLDHYDRYRKAVPSSTTAWLK